MNFRVHILNFLPGLLLLAAGCAPRGVPPPTQPQPPAPPPDAAERACLNLRQRVPSWHWVDLPSATNPVTLTAADSLTVEALRGVALDDQPPQLRAPPPASDPRMCDDGPSHARPYVAEGILPFRLRAFHCEFNYGGWHNFDMMDYAAMHGFSIIFPYNRKPQDVAHWPDGTRQIHWGGFVNWHEWLPKHGIEEGRYDQLVDLDLVKMHLDAGLFTVTPVTNAAWPQFDSLMIDMEHPVLSPEKLRQQRWYPAAGTAAERQAFEARYFKGYGLTYLSTVAAARRQGWKRISVYGWYPYGRTWGGLEQVEPDPGTDVAWNNFGREIYDAVDIINNSVYCFYWTPQNVAYTLANVDMNMKMVASRPLVKPVRPYYWTLLHGGGGGDRWWRDQPLPDEEQRAMTAMTFFTGVDGFDTWNWSGTASHHTVRPEAPVTNKTGDVSYTYVMVGQPFDLPGAAAAPYDACRRYDILRIVEVDRAAGVVTFRKVRRDLDHRTQYGLATNFPAFTMGTQTLVARLRPKSAPVAAMVEGLALIKPFEEILRRGSVKIDVSAQQQFAQTLPLVRRVTFGAWHILATYDPKVVHGGAPRPVVLPNFGGVPGRTLTLPADAQTRIFVLREKNP